MSVPYTSSHPGAEASAGSALTRALWGIAVAWFAATAALGFSGFFSAHTRVISLFVLVPVAVFVAAFAVSPGLRAWAFALDTRALVFVQAVRVGGIAFLAVHAVDKLNGAFALWAGLIDAATGLSAPFAAHYLVPTRSPAQRRLLIAWMATGILDFVVALPLAMIVRTSDPAGMAALTMPPLSMITTFAVPLAIMAYVILGAHVWRQRRPA
jgi:hypothetical protein